MKDSKTKNSQPSFQQPKPGAKYLFIGLHLFPREGNAREIETGGEPLKVIELEPGLLDLNEDGLPGCIRFKVEGNERQFVSYYPWAFIEDTPENREISDELQRERKKLAEQADKVAAVRKKLVTLELMLPR